MKRNLHNNMDLYEVVVEVAKVNRTTTGGRAFSFRVVVVVGDKKGYIGFGSSSHGEVVEAKKKAINQAKKRFYRVHLRENRTIHHAIYSKYKCSSISMKPVRPGRGVIAGGTMRKVCEVLGIKDISTKSHTRASCLNTIRNMLQAFDNISSPKDVANRRGKKVSDIVRNRKG